jgi:hypothetical protein
MMSLIRNHMFSVGTSPKPAWVATPIYGALFTTNPSADDGTGKVEPSGLGYQRILISPASMTTASTSTGAMENSAEIVWPQATADYLATVKGAGLYNALTGGNLLEWGIISPNETVTSGEAFTFPIGAFDLLRLAA